MGFELDAGNDVNQTVAQVTTRSLRDVAQPLTVLQGIIELSLMRDRTAEEYRMALESALQEVERVTIRLDHVRHLMRLHAPAGDMGRLFGVPRAEDSHRRPAQLARLHGDGNCPSGAG